MISPFINVSVVLSFYGGYKVERFKNGGICTFKMKTGKIDIMPCLGKKGDREKYMNLNKYYAGNISISKKSVFSKHNAMFEISAENIKKKQSWHDWGKSHNYK